MKSLLFWLLIVGAVYFFLRSAVADARLWSERRPEAPPWKVWFSPWRYFSENLYTAAGEAARRDAVRSLGWALLLIFSALLVRAL